MRLFLPIAILVAASRSILSHHLSFRLEESEFSIVISATTQIIDNALSQASDLQITTDKSKSIKAMRKISKSINKARNVKIKFLMMAGESQPNSRNIFNDITDLSGLVIGKVFGLASSKKANQLSSAIDNIRYIPLYQTHIPTAVSQAVVGLVVSIVR